MTASQTVLVSMSVSPSLNHWSLYVCVCVCVCVCGGGGGGEDGVADL